MRTGVDLTRIARTLLVAVAWLAALSQLWRVAYHLRDHALGWDARAYFDAWDGGLYELAPGQAGAYNYSPLFAQLTWPLAQLPWPVYLSLVWVAAVVGIFWLLRRARPSVALVLAVLCVPDVLAGNLFWLMAVALVLGTTRGWPWLLSAFTKVLPAGGLLWFVVRREWRPLVQFVVVAVVLAGVSYAASPGLWHDWVDFLTTSSGSSDVEAFGIVWPLWVRLLGGLVLVVLAALLDHRWLLVVALVVSSPVIGAGTWALWAALPRLLDQDAASRARREGPVLSAPAAG